MVMLLLSGGAIGCVMMFALGWVAGYKKACHAHGWNLPKLNWDNRGAARFKGSMEPIINDSQKAPAE